MPYVVQTAEGRLAIARRDRDRNLAEIDGEIRTLAAKHGVTDRDTLRELAQHDEQLQRLFLKRVLVEQWCEMVIEDDDLVPTIGEPDEPVRWRRRQDANARLI
jgi:hypothetical protein